MTLYVIFHISKGQTFYRAQSEHDKGWSTNIDRAELYTEDELPAAFAGMQLQVQEIEGKLVMG